MKLSQIVACAGNMKLRTKMLSLAGIVFAGFFLSAFSGLYLLNQVRIGSPIYTKIKNNNVALERIAILRASIGQVRAKAGFLIMGRDPSVIGQLQADIRLATSEIDDKFSEILNLVDMIGRKTDLMQAKEAWQEYEQNLQNSVIPAVLGGNWDYAKKLDDETQKPHYNKCIDSINEEVDQIKIGVNDLEASAVNVVRLKIVSSATISLIIFTVILSSILVITRSIIRPMEQGIAFAQSVAEGNLAERLESITGGEVGALTEALNGMAKGLSVTVAQITRSAQELTVISQSISKSSKLVINAAELQAGGISKTSTAVGEINTSIMKVSDGVGTLSASASVSASSVMEIASSLEETAMNVDKLARSVEEVSSSIMQMAASISQIERGTQALLDEAATTASSIAEMDASIKQVKTSAIETAAIAAAVETDAQLGKSSVDAAISGMSRIRQSSQITSEVIHTLSTKAENIGAILSVIDEVAEQTNLLALNAAIIASQAGEHGKGFAVVADEIKELADRTSSSTREIVNLIKGVQDETRRAVEVIIQAEQSIAEGVLLSKDSGEALNKIVTGAQLAVNWVNGIACATVEQANGSMVIREAMERVSDMVGQIARSTREQTTGSEMIIAAAHRMRELTNQVNKSTREQSNVGSVIARSTEEINEMIRQIKEACDKQMMGSDHIVHAINDIQQSTSVNLEAAKVMDEAVSNLSGQIKVLQTEMVGFTVEG